MIFKRRSADAFKRTVEKIVNDQNRSNESKSNIRRIQRENFQILRQQFKTTSSDTDIVCFDLFNTFIVTSENSFISETIKNDETSNLISLQINLSIKKTRFFVINMRNAISLKSRCFRNILLFD